MGARPMPHPHPIDLSEWPAERIHRTADTVRRSPHKTTSYALQLAAVAEAQAEKIEAMEAVQTLAMIERCSRL